MTFSNLQVTSQDLPDADQVKWQPLHKNYKFAVILEAVFAIAFIVAVAIFVVYFLVDIDQSIFNPMYIGLTALAIGVAYAIANLIAIRFHGFAIREHDVLYQRGLFFRKRVAIPIARIQHVEVGSGPLERFLGLSRLQLFTAGTAGSDLLIRGIDEKTADAMRRYLLKRARRAG